MTTTLAPFGATTEPVGQLLFTVKQAGQMLSLTPWQAYQLVMAGTLPSGRIGRIRVIHVDDLRAYARSVTS